MWKYIIRLILRNRWTNLTVIILITALMGYLATQVKMSYEMAQMLPTSDPTYVAFENFKKKFGEDGSVLFVGVKDKKLNELKYFNKWFDLTHEMAKVPGVKATLSLAKAFQLTKDEEIKRFRIEQIIPTKPKTQAELDSLLKIIKSGSYYNGTLFNSNNATILAITLDQKYLASSSRFELLSNIKEKTEAFESVTGIKVHYSGLPYIRIYMSKMIKDEVLLFSILTLIIASILLYLFFKSFVAVIFPMIVVAVSVIWSIALLPILGYKITILTGILPPLITIIAVENVIFMLNKYHVEYKRHRNKIKALARMIQTVGTPMILTNLTTAVGFGSFIITQNHLLVEFGIITSLSIVMVFLLSLFLVPIFFSLQKPPTEKQIKHLNRKQLQSISTFIKRIVLYHRGKIYWTALIIVVLGFIGMFMLKTQGNVVDDLPTKGTIYTDLEFFEKEFKGVLPFEIQIDTKKKKGVMQMATLKRISRLQDSLAKFDVFSKSLSIADLVKIAKQAYYNNDPEKYGLPNSYETAFIMNYLPENFDSGNSTNMLKSFVDSNLQVTRLTVQMKNINTNDIDLLVKDLRPTVDSIFNPEKYDVNFTGTSMVFLMGTNFLVSNLVWSLLLAVVIISLLMMMLFTSYKMVIISILPNLLPLVLTAALMGYLDINIKPSTIIIFSISLGISVDNTIHFLSRYRLELRKTNWNIKSSVLAALGETVQSMIYSSIILFFGFSVFMFSSFGGTQSLGKLISITLLTAMMANLIILPTLLLTLDRWMTTKNFKEPFFEILHEEDDIDISNLEIEDSTNYSGKVENDEEEYLFEDDEKHLT